MNIELVEMIEGKSRTSKLNILKYQRPERIEFVEESRWHDGKLKKTAGYWHINDIRFYTETESFYIKRLFPPANNPDELPFQIFFYPNNALNGTLVFKPIFGRAPELVLVDGKLKAADLHYELANIERTPLTLEQQGRVSGNITTADESPADQGVFQEHDKDQWQCCFHGQILTDLGKTRIGFKYIRTLLRNPEATFSPLALKYKASEELADVIESSEDVKMDMKNNNTTIKSYGWTPECVIDEKGIEQIKERIEDLEDLLKDLKLDPEINAKEIREKSDELKQLEDILKTNTRGGKPRRIDPEMEKARKQITKAISEAIDYIAFKQDDIAEHFENYIHTGNYFSYDSADTWLT